MWILFVSGLINNKQNSLFFSFLFFEVLKFLTDFLFFWRGGGFQMHCKTSKSLTFSLGSSQIKKINIAIVFINWGFTRKY